MSKNKLLNGDLPHQHLLVNAITDDIKGYLSEELIISHIKKLADIINSPIIIPPKVKYSISEGNTGYASIAGIATSHIACHHWDNENPQRLQIDIYSCINFNFIDALKEIWKFWKINIGNVIVMDRSIKYGFYIKFSAFFENYDDIINLKENYND